MHKANTVALALALALFGAACPPRSSRGLDQQTGPMTPGPAAQDQTVSADRTEQRPDELLLRAPPLDPTQPDGQLADALVAVVKGTPDFPDIRGVVRLHKMGDEIHVATMVEGLPAGDHGYHVHLYGDCTAPKASAGPHLDFGALPGSTQATGDMLGTEPTEPGILEPGPGTAGTEPATPGHPMEDQTLEGHPSPHVLGDLGELRGVKGQTARAEAAVPLLTADHLGALLGRAVVIHEKGNDPSVPDGAAGEAIACGVLGVASAASIPGAPEGTPNPEPIPRP